MDDPFAALNDSTRGKLNADLLRRWVELNLAALFSVAELATDDQCPRQPAFRTSAAFVEACAGWE